MRTWMPQLKKGLAELAVLGALSKGEAYGYQILQRLNEADTLSLGESTVYPILARLTEEGYARVRTAPSPSGPPRRYYSLTRLGRARLSEMLTIWHETVDAVRRICEADEDDNEGRSTRKGVQK